MIRHSIHYKVTWGDTDPAGIVFYPRFLQWMDRAAHEWFEAVGLPASETFRNKGIGFPVLEVRCEFRSPVPYGSVLEIETRVEEVRNKVFKLRHEFRLGGEPVATGSEIRAWTDFTGERPQAVPIPEDVRTRWQRGMEHE